MAGMFAFGNNHRDRSERLIRVTGDSASTVSRTALAAVALRPKNGVALRIIPNRVPSCAKSLARATKSRLWPRG